MSDRLLQFIRSKGTAEPCVLLQRRHTAITSSEQELEQGVRRCFLWCRIYYDFRSCACSRSVQRGECGVCFAQRLRPSRSSSTQNRSISQSIVVDDMEGIDDSEYFDDWKDFNKGQRQGCGPSWLVLLAMAKWSSRSELQPIPI